MSQKADKPVESNPLLQRLRTEGRLGFGGAPIGNLYEAMPDADALAAVDAAWQGGLRYFDTAPHYGLGLSERRIGQVLADKPRDEFLLSTKVGRLLRPNPDGTPGVVEAYDTTNELTRVRDYSADGVRRSIEESLERLGTDRIDIVYIHDPDDYWDEAISGAVPALSQLRDEGVIGAYGAGMNQAEMLERFVREGDPDLVMCAGRYTLLEQQSSESLREACGEHGVGIVNVGVFNSGLLATERPPADAHYNYEQAPTELIARANELADLAEQHGTTLPVAALAFSYRNPLVTSVVLGMRTADEVRADVALAARGVPEEFWTEAAERGFIA